MSEPFPYFTTATKLVFRVLLDAKEPMWTGEIAAAADLRWETTRAVLNRLADADWALTKKQHGLPPRRFWELTDDGRTRVIERLERAAAPRQPRAQFRGQSRPTTLRGGLDGL